MSIIYRCFFSIAFALGLFLSYWQYERAQRPELQDSPKVYLRPDYITIDSWEYERGDRSIGRYDIMSNGEQIYVVEVMEIGEGPWRVTSWNVPRWVDKKGLVNVSTHEKSPTLTALLSRLRERHKEKIFLLVPAFTERDLSIKRHRHYGYALQWGILAAVSMRYLLQADKK